MKLQKNVNNSYQKKAKAIKTNESGEEELASDEESKAIENVAVLNAMADTESTTKDK